MCLGDILDYKEVKGFGDAIEYLGNNLALSIPYMAITGAATLAAPFTAGLSYVAPASIYTGQVWNEMEGEKNAGYAIAAGVTQAALDRLGLDFILPKGVATKEVFNKAVGAMVKKGWTKEAAEQSLSAATRREIAELAGDVQKIAKSQLEAKALAKDFISRAGMGSISEGLTEAGQELIGYTAAVQGSDKEFDWHDLNNRLISASIAGASLGGGLSASGTAYNAAAWADVAHRTSTDTESTASQAEVYAEQEKAEYGRIVSTHEIAADAKTRFNESPGSTIDERSATHHETQSQKSTADRIHDATKKIPALWQGSVRNKLPPELQAVSRSARKLADLLGGNLQKVFNGPGFENFKHHVLTTYRNMVVEPKNLYELTGINSASKKEAYSDEIYREFNNALDKDGNFDPSKVGNIKNRDMVLQLGKELLALGDKMHSDQKKHNPELGYVKNYLFKYKSLNKGIVHKNQKKFAQLLAEEYKMSPGEAKKLVDEIIDNNEVNDIDQAFSVVRGGISPQSHKNLSLIHI